jgi:hypothetical protein
LICPRPLEFQHFIPHLAISRRQDFTPE